MKMLKNCSSRARAILSACFVILASQGAAQDGPPEIEAITDRGHLIVAMTSFDNPPFYFVDHGHLEGIDVTLAEDIGQALGVEVKFDRTAETFNDVVEKVRRGEADIAVSKISRTNTRARVVAFSRPYVRLHNALMFNRLKFAQNSKGRDLGDYVRNFDGALGVIENSSFATFALRRFPKATIIPFKTWEEVVEATVSGTVDAAYRDEFEVRRITVDRPDTSISLRTVTIADARDAISVVVRWDAPRLLAMVDQVIDDRPAELTADDVIALYRSKMTSEAGH
jgi:polar amino acid transport system substrate-binding protein